MEEILGSSNYNDCPFCPETFKTKKMLMDHIFKDHGYQKEYITTANASISSSQNESNLAFSSKDEGKFGQWPITNFYH